MRTPWDRKRALAAYGAVLALIVTLTVAAEHYVRTHATYARGTKPHSMIATAWQIIRGFITLIPEMPLLVVVGLLVALACIIVALVLISRGISYPSYAFMRWMGYSPSWHRRADEKVFPGYGPFGERRQSW